MAQVPRTEGSYGREGYHARGLLTATNAAEDTVGRMAFAIDSTFEN